MCSGLVTVLYIIECVARAVCVCRGWLSRPGRKRANLRATLCVVFPSNNSLFPDVVYSRALDLFCLPVEIYRLQQQHNRLQRQVGLIEFNKVNSSFILFVFAESLTANFNNVVTEFEHMFTVLPEKRDGPIQLVGGSPWELWWDNAQNNELKIYHNGWKSTRSITIQRKSRAGCCCCTLNGPAIRNDDYICWRGEKEEGSARWWIILHSPLAYQGGKEMQFHQKLYMYTSLCERTARAHTLLFVS